MRHQLLSMYLADKDSEVLMYLKILIFYHEEHLRADNTTQKSIKGKMAFSLCSKLSHY